MSRIQAPMRARMRAWMRMARLAALLLLAIPSNSWARPPGALTPSPTPDPRGYPVIDIHVHAAGIGAGGSGAFISEEMKTNFRYGVYIFAMGVTEEELEEDGDAITFQRVSEQIANSSEVDKAVMLALDGVISASGELDRERTSVYVPNDYVARETARYDNLLFGASINPNRHDALERLNRARAQGAVLVKWIPSIMDIDPADPRFEPFYREMVELGLPLLTHTGQERAFPGARDELADPHRLKLPLSLGVTVIAAHIATTGQSEGQDNFERILPMFAEYPTLHADISSLTQINKLGFLERALAHPGLPERLVYGSDWPLQFFPMVSPWFHLDLIPFDEAWRISTIANQWDRDVALKRGMGTPEEIFRRTAELLAPQPGIPSADDRETRPPLRRGSAARAPGTNPSDSRPRRPRGSAAPPTTP